MEQTNRRINRLLFDEFIVDLRRRGFIIGVDHHLRLQELLNKLGADCTYQDLKYLLCPIFSVNEKQQEQFYRVFDSFFQPFYTKEQIERYDEKETGIMPGPGEKEKTPGEPGLPPKWQYILLGFLLIINIFLVFHTMGYFPGLSTKDKNPTPVPTPTPKPVTTQSHTPVTVQSPTPTSANAGLEDAAKERTGRLDDLSFWQRYGRYLPLAGFLLPLIFLLLIEMYKYNRRKLVLLHQHGKKPPLVWPITVVPPELGIVKNEQFYTAARFLRQRVESDILRIDINKTVGKTIATGGFTSLIYQNLTKPPEYLFLVDIATYRDHHVQLFHSITGALEKEGIFVKRYFYKKDPRICFEEPGEQRIYLSDLKARYSSHRLIIFGDGEKLLDPLIWGLEKWTLLFQGWCERAILTPVNPKNWGMRETVLAKEFIILPFSVHSLGALVDYFEMQRVPDGEAERESGSPTVSLATEEMDNVDILREHLGENTFQWLCACAVYPGLHWDLTLYLGSLSCMPENLLEEENLLRLIRLPYFHKGVIPDELRWKLIGELDIDKSKAIRAAIIELLEKNPPPRESVAYDTYRLHLVVQRWLLSGKDRKRRKEMLKSLRMIDAKHIQQDYTLLRFLESVPHSRLNFLLPQRLKKIFYRRGLPIFGMKTGFRVVLTFLLSFALFFALKLLDNWMDKQFPGDIEPVITEITSKRKNNEQGYLEAEFTGGIVMIYIPAGEFTMGSDKGYNNEKPEHKVYLDDYWIGKYEVTFEQYDIYCEQTGKEKPGDAGWGRGKQPVINVSWDDAVIYCNWLSQETGLKFKLPTEAQWEKAARGTDAREYPWGKDFDEEKLNISERGTRPVGSYPAGASPYGCLDIAGNVWEWCSDWYDGNYYKNSPGKNPVGPGKGDGRVLRGGSWNSDASDCSSAYRRHLPPAYSWGFGGFRLLREIEKK